MDLQTLHVSQLYETFAAFAILLILVAEVLACRQELWSHSFAFRLKQHEEQDAWRRSKYGEEIEEVGPDLQKSAIQSLRREMTEYQKKNSEKEKQEGEGQEKKQEIKEQNLKFVTQLTPSQKSILLFYIEYNNFVSQHISIILSILVLGMLTYSTRIYSLAAFFCYLFCSLLFDFLHLQERLKAQYKRGTTIRRLVKIISCLFLFGVFISYWSLTQFLSQ